MTVSEGFQEDVTHEDVPTTSEGIMTTGYHPGEDTEEEHTVYTVMRNVNASLFDKGAYYIRRFFKPDNELHLG
jgi:hypothetical protein